MCPLSAHQTFMVGNVDEEGKALVETAFRCLAAGIDLVEPGAMYREIGAAIGKVARERGGGFAAMCIVSGNT